MVKNGKIAPEKSAPECPFECGGGCNCYLGNAQIEVVTNWKVLPLGNACILGNSGPATPPLGWEDEVDVTMGDEQKMKIVLLSQRTLWDRVSQKLKENAYITLRNDIVARWHWVNAGKSVLCYQDILNCRCQLRRRFKTLACVFGSHFYHNGADRKTNGACKSC